MLGVIPTDIVVADVIVTDFIVTNVVVTDVIAPSIRLRDVVVTVVPDDRRRLAAALIGPRADLLRRARVLLCGLARLRGVGFCAAGLRLGLRGARLTVGGGHAVALDLRLELLSAAALLLRVLLLALARDDHGDDDREGHDDDEDDDEGDDLRLIHEANGRPRIRSP